MDLLTAQMQFSLEFAKLVIKATELGYGVTMGDCYRDQKIKYGHPNSTHRKRLAVDINLFKGTEWLKNTEDHRELGEWWEKQHPLARWGGRFGDGNHYSFEWDGVK